MANRKFRTAASPVPSDKSKADVKSAARKRMRRVLFETLECRRLLAVGPQLIGIQPNNSDLLTDGAVRTTAPRELTFRFDDAQVIDTSTLQGIRISRSGGDGTFGQFSAESDFGTAGAVNMQFVARQVSQAVTIQFTRADLGSGIQPSFSAVGTTLSVTLNSNASTPTRAGELVNAINLSPVAAPLVVASIRGGHASTIIGSVDPVRYSPVSLTQANDVVLSPGASIVGATPNENEVTLRFAENLPDDTYRIEVFGFDDPVRGIVGLRAVGAAGAPGALFAPTVAGTRQDTIDFRLDLGSQVSAIVPQPVVRLNGQLTQQRDTIVVYFDSDKLLVENDANGLPTNRSAENPAFYQLILTQDSVRNTDDQYFTPISVKYNAAANTATLKFAGDINGLAGVNAPAATYRLRIGTRESAPLAPSFSEAAATAITDLNTAGRVKMRFTARAVGEAGNGIQVVFVNSGSGTPSVVASGTVITVDVARNDVTAQQLLDLIRNSSAASNLISADLIAGSDANLVVGNGNLSFSPVVLVGLGSTYDTAMNIGTIGSATQPQTSLVFNSAIDAQAFTLDLQGANDDPGQRSLPQNQTGGFEEHVNPAFGADKTAGITTIYYNFKTIYSTDNLGVSLVNAISNVQKQRAREALELWSNYIGVQFVETADMGVTIATGQLTGLRPLAGTQIQSEANFGFGVRIDPTFANSLLILSATNTWDNSYGETYFRAALAGFGEILGLQHAGDLPETTLMRLDPTFMAGSSVLTNANDQQLDASDEQYEPIFPGNQDVLHGQYVFRPDSSDVDLYRFEVDFGGQDRVGLFTAETYAQRLRNGSPLNTMIELFKETQATASTSFGLGDGVSLKFTAVRPGQQGNNLQVFFTQSDRGANAKPGLLVFPNAISIDLNSRLGSESTIGDVVQLLNTSSAASKLVKVSIERGSATTVIGGLSFTQNPVVLRGGSVDLVSKNDDYFSDDSFIKQSLTSGVYYIGVSASGNGDYNGATAGTGFGGNSQGDYQLRVTFRAQVDTNDALQDIAGSNNPSVTFDGDGDGLPGGTNDFWFQTRSLDRVLNFNAGATSALEGRTITVIGANNVQRDFEFDSNGSITPGRFAIIYSPSDTAGALANALAAAIAARSELGVSAIANGTRLTIKGERVLRIDPALTLIDVGGKTIFVDKSAGPNADGSLAKPFNNISGSGVPNAFAAALPGDIVRIVGNGGTDGNVATIGDNFAYEIGSGLLAGTTLTDGSTMEVPRGVTAMVDSGVIFKLNRARIGVGSSNLNVNRSESALQVLGTPVLTDANGNVLKTAAGAVAKGSVFFTSWLDESIGLDTYGPRTTPAAGDWGGISYRNDVDGAAGRRNLENEGIFLQYVNNADIRYGGGTVVVDSVQQTVNPIEMLDVRPTITFNQISFGANAAMSALPNSFAETNFNEPRFQVNGAFTSDYDRVGPEIRRNTLTNNSLNGLFVRVDTPADNVTRTLSVSGRFDDIDVVHVLAENLVVSGQPGGALLDSTVPLADLISTAPNVGGTLVAGTYSYKITYLDRFGYESLPSNASVSLLINPSQTAISIAGIPAASGDFIARRLYRSTSSNTGPYELVATLDKDTSTYLDIGKSLGGLLLRDRPNVSTVSFTSTSGGTLAAGSYSYRVVMLDAAGREGLASDLTSSFTLSSGNTVRITGLPVTLPSYVGRRIYRSVNGGAPVRVVDLLDTNSAGVTTYLDTGVTAGGALSPDSLAIKRPRVNASLVIDPGTVLKLEGARIEATFGANIIAEGTEELPITFTSKLDDTIGAGGTFDTNNNGASNGPQPRDWGGIYMAPTSTLSVDHARIAYAGGVTKLEGTFRAFNTIELHQAEARIANTLFENNANGFGGQGPATRFGRLSNAPSTLFVRGSQPVLINNEFRGNKGSAIDIDANSMNEDILRDPGRQTGDADVQGQYDANRGPLIRGNRFANNDLNGLEIRGDFLTTGSVWDDTDIVHVVYDGIFVSNLQHDGGLRLQSAPNESLVVKFLGYGSNFNRNMGAGITANGQLSTGDDRVGGTLHVLGQPGFPVILTSLRDDTVGAGLKPDGTPQTDTNNDGIGSIPQSADWRGILLDQYSNDRNVAMVLETESFAAAAPGPNGSALSAQVLGDLAANPSSSNENLRLGFSVEGVLSQESDVDVYSFTGVAGTEVWLDVDYTENYSDLVLELLDANGALLARSDNSTAETANPNLLTTTGLINSSNVNRMPNRVNNVRTTASGLVKEDGTTNVYDPGMRVLLPGTSGTRSTYYFRLRSAGTDINNLQAGLTKGSYQVQVRMREQQEFAGSAVDFSDIRYAMNGVHLRGLPTSSPLMGEVQEDESVGTGATFADNGTAVGQTQVGSRPQYIGNILNTAKGAISVAGTLNSSSDVDFYRLDVTQEDLVGSLNGYASVAFDIDYADGLNRPDTSINIFQELPSALGNQYRLIYSGDSSNIADDQRKPLTITDIEDLSRGSVGTKDAYVGPVALPQGTYLVAVSSQGYQPRTRLINPFSTQPINSIRRIVDTAHVAGQTTAVAPVVTNFLPRTNIGGTGQLDSATFSLAGYSSDDQPALYMDYTTVGSGFSIFVKNAAGVETLVASTPPVSTALVSLALNGSNNVKIPLNQFAGQSGLSLVMRSSAAATNVDRVIIGFAERGEAIGVPTESILLNATFLGISQTAASRTFSLVTYSFADGPTAVFDYEIFSGDIDIFITDQFGFTTRLATSVAPAGFGEVLLTRGSPQTARLNLTRWANQPGLTLTFVTRNANPTRVFIDDVTMELADGSRVFSGEYNPTYVNVPSSSTMITTGAYQLEVRMAENFFQSSPSSFIAPTLTKSFDTNDRFAEQIAIIAPAGSGIADGDLFELSDGGNTIVFEFSTDATVSLGNVPVRFTTADASFVVARSIRDAINNPNVQSRLRVRAATSGGFDSGTTGQDTKLNLFGNASIKRAVFANPATQLQVVAYSGSSDQNVIRDQGQIIIQNSFIRDSRDYGVWSEPAGRLLDPRDDISNDFESFIMQSKPGLTGTQAVRNLLNPNNSVAGGLVPGVVVQNNVLQEGGLGGVFIQGENPIWMISPSVIPSTDNLPTVNANGSHVGSFVDDGDQLVIDVDRTRVKFEFEDLAGAPTGGPSFGSGQVEGDGVSPDAVPVWYREEGGSAYKRPTPSPLVPFATTGLETMMALRDSILGSILVTSGTTQMVRATVAESLLGPDTRAPLQSSLGYPNYFNRPALYIEGPTNIQMAVDVGNGGAFDIRQVDLGQSPQPHARVVNNTIIGKDGRASFSAQSATESNDTLASATETWQGTSHNPLSYTSNGAIGDNPATSRNPSQDVDIYQFKLETGERAIIDIDSIPGSTLDSVLQIFDSKGIAQSFVNSAGQRVFISDNDAAPGEVAGLDPYVDFTATSSGVFYAALSSFGNTAFDPLSMANRQTGTTTGGYSISVAARHLQQFTITAQDANQYRQGQTFTIYGVPDIGATGSAGRTFEFTFGGGVTPGNIPIQLGATWRFPDVARAIARAINQGNNGSPVISNAQSLPNGSLGTASPLPPVLARALGGMAGILDADLDNISGDPSFLYLDPIGRINELGTDAIPNREAERLLSGPIREVNQGLQLFPNRNDGNYFATGTGFAPTQFSGTHSSYGIGSDRLSTVPISRTSWGDGTTEKFVVVRNAAYIEGNGSIIVDPDAGANNNLDQFLPETGVLASRGASPSILNNVFFNVQTPVINEESRFFPLTGGIAPYGTNNPNLPTKPGEVVLGGSIFQSFETASAQSRFATGIEASPTNVPNTTLDQNVVVPGTTKLFVNAQAGQFLPAPQSPVIDSSFDSLPERPALAAVKQAMGISVSPILAPATDLVGQLRADDPSVASPGGQGQNVFKDRGALDRADFAGPAAILLDPIDNDAFNVDKDSSLSVVQLTEGVYPEFRIQLSDGNEPANPLRGIGINDDSVTNSIIPDRRLTGAAIVLFENGRMLLEGIDYTFAYNATRDEIVLTPLAGVWKNDRVYQISLNNKNRFVVLAPRGDQIADGDSFTVLDSLGGTVNYEFDSGYRLQVPQGLTIQAPLAGGASGGAADGDRFVISDGVRTVTFEFDRNGNVLTGNVAVPFSLSSTQADIANAVAAAISGTALAVTPRILSGGRVFLGAETNVRLNTNASALSQPATTLGLKIPDLGPRPGGITDGQTFTVSDGRRTVTFEYDNNTTSTVGNTVIDFSAAATVGDLARLTQAALAASSLKISPTIVGGDMVHLGLPAGGTVSAGTSRLTVLGVARTLTDGQRFTISNGTTTKTFEFTRDANVTPGNIGIPVALNETQDEIGEKVANAIAGAGLGLTPDHISDGNISVKGGLNHSIDVSNAPVLSLFGKPGVQTNTQLQVFGPLLMQVPARGGVDIVDNRVFTIINNGRTVTFEFDNNFSGPSQPGNVIIRYTGTSTANDIANSIVFAITGAGLALTPINLGGGRIELGMLESNQVVVGSTGLVTSRGVVSDGETFTINNGTTSVTFEFDNVDFNNGFTQGRTPILFRNNSTPESVVDTMKAVIEGAGLSLTTTVLPAGVLQLNDTPRFVIDTTGAPSLRRSGVPGGANAVSFVQDPSFSSENVKQSIIDAINASGDTSLIARDRGGNTLFVENANSISSQIDNYFLKGIADLGGNTLKPNRINNETAFTILMPGIDLDFGDSPDPLSTTSGRYATLKSSDGARHVVGANVAILGATIDAESDALPSRSADSDVDDGVVFGSLTNPSGLFNKFIGTDVQVTLNSPGYVDGWIDFNADGDWDDPGEQVLSSELFEAGQLSRVFVISVPSTTPAPATSTTTFARFRSSSTGGLQPSGLAVDGEVEDYSVTIVPGTPPTPVNDSYTFNEDTTLVTTDPTGSATPGFVIDDGIAANDTDPEGGPFNVVVISGPSEASAFSMNPNGTFSYTPKPNFNGVDKFTYRVSDGTLASNGIGTVTLIVREVNDTPVVGDDTTSTSEDVPLSLLESLLISNDSAGPAEESGQTLRITGVQTISAQGGSVALVGGRVVYTPPANFGSAVDTFTYTVTDNGTSIGLPAPLSATGTVTISVLDANDPPLPGSDRMANVAEDASGSISVVALLSNDVPGPASEGSQKLSINRVIATSTRGGTVTLNAARTIVTYTPAPNFSGEDTFFYEVTDDGFSGTTFDPKTSTGTVSVTVVGSPDSPFDLNPIGSVTVAEDSAARTYDLSTFFSDPDVATSGDTLTYSLFSNSNAALATPTVAGNTLTVPLVADANGQTVIVVEAKDSTNSTARSTLTVNVTEVNDAPRLIAAIPDQNMLEDGSPVNITLSPNFFFDPDVATNGDRLTIGLVENTNGLLVTPTLSNGVLTLTLVGNQFGTSQITVQATDSKGLAVNDTFILTVAAVNDAPVGKADDYSVPQGGTLTTTDPRGVVGTSADDGVLANDTDVEGNPLTATLVTGPLFGTVQLNTNGTFTYRHTGATRTTDTFTYKANDGSLDSGVTIVTITIGAPSAPPHQNPIRVGNEPITGHRDVNADGSISPIDALIVINFLNINGSVPVAGLPAPPPYRDVDGNNTISAFDALLVINYLNNRGSGEGESDSESVNLSESLGEQGWASAYFGAVQATRASDNVAIGMRQINLLPGEVYGPQLPASDLELFDEEANMWSQMAEGEFDGIDDSFALDSEQSSEAVDAVFSDLAEELGRVRFRNRQS